MLFTIDFFKGLVFLKLLKEIIIGDPNLFKKLYSAYFMVINMQIIGENYF